MENIDHHFFTEPASLVALSAMQYGTRDQSHDLRGSTLNGIGFCSVLNRPFLDRVLFPASVERENGGRTENKRPVISPPTGSLSEWNRQHVGRTKRGAKGGRRGRRRGNPCRRFFQTCRKPAERRGEEERTD